MQYISPLIGWIFAFFSLGNSAVMQHNAQQMQKQQMAQQQAIQQQQLEQRYHLHCDQGFRIVVVHHADGTSDAVCR